MVANSLGAAFVSKIASERGVRTSCRLVKLMETGEGQIYLAVRLILQRGKLAVLVFAVLGQSSSRDVDNYVCSDWNKCVMLQDYGSPSKSSLRYIRPSLANSWSFYLIAEPRQNGGDVN